MISLRKQVSNLIKSNLIPNPIFRDNDRTTIDIVLTDRSSANWETVKCSYKVPQTKSEPTVALYLFATKSSSIPS